MIAAALFVYSSDVEGVKCPTLQIWDITGRGGGSAAGVISSPLGQHIVAVGSFWGIPRHPGRVWYTVQTTLSVPGHTWSCGGWNEKEWACRLSTVGITFSLASYTHQICLGDILQQIVIKGGSALPYWSSMWFLLECIKPPPNIKEVKEISSFTIFPRIRWEIDTAKKK